MATDNSAVDALDDGEDEAGVILNWLQSTELPTTPIELHPWLTVADPARLSQSLQATLANGPGSAGWETALETARRLKQVVDAGEAVNNTKDVAA